MSALTVRALTVPGRLNGVSFALGSGTLAAAVGPNGSGKSTLLQAAAGLLPTGGDVELEGRPLPRIAVIDRARRLAWVPQEASFQFAFSVREVVSQGRYMWADDGKGVDERHRVSLARAVATGAGLQLWDEPVAQLDVRHGLEVLALARRFANGGAAFLVSLHDLRMAHSFDRVLLLQRGRLVADGRPEEVLSPAAILEVFGVRARFGASLHLELPDDRRERA